MIRTAAVRLAAVLALVGSLGTAYLFLIRPGQLRWGATAEEVARPMPDDGIVARPAFDATRAITIHGRPEDIWPWLVQMGYGRAGFYGFDLIENPGGGTGIRSAQTILPAFQHPQTGDPLPLSVAATLTYGSIQANHSLVWRGTDEPPSGVFIWELVPVDATHTRLISRIRWRYLPSTQGFALGLFTEFADHVAVRAILRGVRDRVEGRTPEPLVEQAAEMSAWFLATLELGAGIVFVVFWQRWGRAWLLALCAGLLLQFVLYGPAPAWANALQPWLYLAILLWTLRRERAWSISAQSQKLRASEQVKVS